jgi:phosphate transport system permease protein
MPSEKRKEKKDAGQGAESPSSEEALKKRAGLKRRARLKRAFKRRRIVRCAEEHLRERYRRNAFFTAACALALWANVALLAGLALTLLWSARGAFLSTYIALPAPRQGQDVHAVLAERVGAEKGRAAKREIFELLSAEAASSEKAADGTLWVKASSDADVYVKRGFPEEARERAGLSERQAGWLKKLRADGALKQTFNADFWTRGDSNYPETAGILIGLIGVAGVTLLCMALAFPVGAMTAVYLEEFAPKGRFADMAEVNINNLAAVPSVIFGLLGLSLYIGHFGTPRSSILVGGLTLAMMALPIVVIASRSALRSVPDSVRDGALALGATRMQAVLHHVLPMAMPGMMTGVVLGVARVLGETAPLILVGMVAFISAVPADMLDPATTLPVQIYMWSDRPEAGFREKTAAAIVLLLALLLTMNAVAGHFRRKYDAGR